MRQCLILSASDALGNLFLRLDVTCHWHEKKI
jgi:hypothetical protein